MSASEQNEAAAPSMRWSRGWLFAAGAVALGCVGIAVWMTGPAPTSATAKLPASPPPLALPSDEPTNSPLSRAAAQLTAGDLKAARAGFIDIVASEQDNEAAQVGLQLSGWSRIGPRAVERDLTQLAREYPESALVALNVGVVRSLLGSEYEVTARESLDDAVELGQRAADPTSLRMARLADDLRHPAGFRGYMPILVRPTDVPEASRKDLERLLGAVGRDDRGAARTLAESLEQSKDPYLAMAVIGAQFEKGDGARSAKAFEALAAATDDRAAFSRASLHRGLALMWDGGRRSQGCESIGIAAGATSDRVTRSFAQPIYRELCE